MAGWNFSTSPLRVILHQFLTNLELNKSATRTGTGTNTDPFADDDLVKHLLAIDVQRLRFWLVIVIGVVLCVLTAGGNLLVLLSFKVMRSFWK